MLDPDPPYQARHPVKAYLLYPSWSMESLTFFKHVDIMFRFLNFTSVLLFQLALLVVSCNAQNDAFAWEFGGNFVSTSLSECQSLSLVVSSFHNDDVTFGTPPYYMMAMEVGGIPTTDFVGADRSALNWVVNHAAGTTLMLSMVDSNGSAGGVAPNLYTVIAGDNSSCLPPAPTSDFQVTSNVTTTLTTCQPWGLTISGGTQPYSVTLAALDSPIITNVTLGPLDDSFTFIDRADPNTQLIAAISDSNGNFARGTPLVNTQGSSDVSCTGLVSSSGNATAIKEADDAASAAASAAQARKRANTAIAVSVTLILLLFVGGGIYVYLRIRRRQRAADDIDGQDTKPRKFEEVGEPLPITPPLPFESESGRTSSSSSSGARSLPPYPLHRHDSNCPPDCVGDRQLDTPHYPSQFPSNRSQAALGSDPLSQRYNKANEAGVRFIPTAGDVRRAASTLPSHPRARLPSLPSRSISADVRRSPARNSLDPSITPDVVFQHRDGGVVLQELPPPYLDRSVRVPGRL
jgi:hypothetical protein